MKKNFKQKEEEKNSLITIHSPNHQQNTSTPNETTEYIDMNLLMKKQKIEISSSSSSFANTIDTNINLNQVNGWISTLYGTYYDITNGTLGINATPTQMDFLIVGGQTTIQGEMIVENRIKEKGLI